MATAAAPIHDGGGELLVRVPCHRVVIENFLGAALLVPGLTPGQCVLATLLAIAIACREQRLNAQARLRARLLLLRQPADGNAMQCRRLAVCLGG